MQRQITESTEIWQPSLSSKSAVDVRAIQTTVKYAARRQHVLYTSRAAYLIVGKDTVLQLTIVDQDNTF